MSEILSHQRFFLSYKPHPEYWLEAQYFLPINKKEINDKLYIMLAQQQITMELNHNCVPMRHFTIEQQEAYDRYSFDYMTFHAMVKSLIEALPSLPTHTSIPLVFVNSRITCDFSDFLSWPQFFFSFCNREDPFERWIFLVIGVREDDDNHFIKLPRSRYYIVESNHCKIPLIKTALWLFTFMYKDQEDIQVKEYRKSLGDPSEFIQLATQELSLGEKAYFKEPCRLLVGNADSVTIVQSPTITNSTTSSSTNGLSNECNQTIEPIQKKQKIESEKHFVSSSSSPSSSFSIPKDEPISSTTPEEYQCCVCFKNKRKTVIHPCMHNCMCISCANLVNSQSNRCPVCQTNITKIESFF